MKKLLISVLIILICALVIVTGIKGIHLGNINVLGISEIKSENADLEKKLEQATTLVSTDYPSQISTINSDIKAMNNEKQTYEERYLFIFWRFYKYFNMSISCILD